MVASRQLALAGIDVVSRMSGEAALDYLADCPEFPDACLMDNSMPGGMSGTACTQRIRELYPSRIVPVIVLSADAAADAVCAAFAAGASDYVSKPFRREELAARVRALVLAREAHAREGREMFEEMARAAAAAAAAGGQEDQKAVENQKLPAIGGYNKKEV